jgi:hypothetical protein
VHLHVPQVFFFDFFPRYNGILRQHPKELYEVFAQSDNKFSTTIFVLVSAVQKLSRCMSIPAGMMLYAFRP